MRRRDALKVLLAAPAATFACMIRNDGRMGSELTPRQRLLFTQFNQKFFNEKLPGLISQARERIAGEQLQGQRQRGAARGQNPNRPNVQARPQVDRPALRPKANATR